MTPPPTNQTQAPYFCEKCGKKLKNRNMRARKNFVCKDCRDYKGRKKQQTRLISPRYTAKIAHDPTRSKTL